MSTMSTIAKKYSGVAAALCALVALGGCRQTRDGRIVSDQKAQETAKAQVNEAVAKVGTALDAGTDAAGKALDRASEQLEPRLADAAVTARVKARLLADPEVNGLEIDVDTVNGVVALNGRAHTLDQRAEAEKLARGAEGASDVVNLIQVVGEG
jgi:osmotically-inducible protein OsmY